MTKEEIRATDAYQFIYETYIYALTRNPTDMNSAKSIETVAGILNTPEGMQILSKCDVSKIGQIVSTVIEDLTSEDGVKTIVRYLNESGG